MFHFAVPLLASVEICGVFLESRLSSTASARSAKECSLWSCNPFVPTLCTQTEFMEGGLTHFRKNFHFLIVITPLLSARHVPVSYNIVRAKRLNRRRRMVWREMS